MWTGSTKGCRDFLVLCSQDKRLPLLCSSEMLTVRIFPVLLLHLPEKSLAHRDCQRPDYNVVLVIHFYIIYCFSLYSDGVSPADTPVMTIFPDWTERETLSLVEEYSRRSSDRFVISCPLDSTRVVATSTDSPTATVTEDTAVFTHAGIGYNRSDRLTLL